MKKEFVTPEMEVVVFEVNDIILSSDYDDGGYQPGENETPDW
jgi:hypothetical protein